MPISGSIAIWDASSCPHELSDEDILAWLCTLNLVCTAALASAHTLACPTVNAPPHEE